MSALSEQVRNGFIHRGGLPVYYREAGRGVPLVFVHGWSYDLTCWRAQLEHFSPRYRCIAYDLRGMGQSGSGADAYDFAELVQDLHEALIKLDAERPIICGHSIGGSIALQYAVEHPEAVSALVLVDMDLPDREAAVPQYERLKYALQKRGVEDLLPNFRNFFYSVEYQQARPDAILEWQRKFRANSIKGLLALLRAWTYREDLTGRLDQIKAPTLLVVGSAHKFSIMEKMRFIQRRIEGSRLRVIEGAGHMVIEEQPRLFNEALGAFLAEVEED